MAKNPQLTGNNITGVSGAQQGAQKNAAAMQRAAGKAGQAGYEFGTELGATGAQLTGTNITGVPGAQEGAKKNAQSMAKAGRKPLP